jgi:WD40 repeat protein
MRRKPGLLWSDPARLALIRQLRTTAFPGLNRTESEFAEVSIRRARRNQLLRLCVAAALLLLAVAAGGAAYYASTQTVVAIVQRKEAEKQTVLAQRRLAQALISQGFMSAGVGQPERADILFSDAWQLADNDPEARFAANLGRSALFASAPSSLISFRAHDEATAVAVSPDGRFILTGGNERNSGRAIIRLWELRTGTLIRELAGHGDDYRGGRGRVTALAIQSQGKYALSAGTDGRIRFWDLGSGLMTQEIAAHKQVVSHLVLSPDDKTFATAGYDSLVKIWTFGNASPTYTISHKYHADGLAFDRTGVRLAYLVNQDLYIYDLKTRTSLEILSYRKADYEGANAGFVSDDRLAVSGKYGTIIVFNIKTGLVEFKVGRGTGSWGAGDSPPLFVSPNREIAAFRDEMKRLRVVSTRDGKTNASFMIEHSGQIDGIASNADNTILATAGADGLVKVWPLQPSPHRRILPGHRPFVTGTSFSRDGNYLAAVGYDGGLSLLETSAGQLVSVHRHYNPLGAVILSADATIAMLAAWNGPVIKWSTVQWKEIESVEAKVFALDSLAESPDRSTLLSNESAKIVVRDKDFKPVRTLAGPDRAISKMYTSDDAQLVIAATEASTLHLWDSGKHRAVKNHGQVSSIAVSHDRKAVLTCNGDGSIRILNISEVLTSVPMLASVDPISSCWADCSLRYLISLQQSGEVVLWDLENRSQLGVLAVLNDAAGSLRVSDDRKWIAFSSKDSIHLWAADFPDRYGPARARAMQIFSEAGAEKLTPEAFATLAIWYELRGYAEWSVELFEKAISGGYAMSDPAYFRASWIAGFHGKAKAVLDDRKANGLVTDPDYGLLARGLSRSTPVRN